MELWVPEDRKYWVEGGEVSAYTDSAGIVVDDWSGFAFVGGSAWIDVTMHLLDQSDELEADELCRVRDALKSEVPHGFDSDEDRVDASEHMIDTESLLDDLGFDLGYGPDLDEGEDEQDTVDDYNGFDDFDPLYPDDIDGTSIDIEDEDDGDEDDDPTEPGAQ